MNGPGDVGGFYGKVAKSAVDVVTRPLEATLLIGLDFPATKQQVIEHVRQTYPDNTVPSRDKVISGLERKLKDGRSFDSAQEVVAAC